MQISGKIFFGMPLPGFGQYLPNSIIRYIIDQISIIAPFFLGWFHPIPMGFS